MKMTRGGPGKGMMWAESAKLRTDWGVEQDNKDGDHDYLPRCPRRQLRPETPTTNPFPGFPSAPGRKCDVLPSTVPRHPTQAREPPRQQPLAPWPADARPTAGTVFSGRPTAAVARLCIVHQRRSPPAPYSSPPAPSAPASSPKFHVALPFSTKSSTTATPTSDPGLSSECNTRRFAPVAAAVDEVRGMIECLVACSVIDFF